VPVAVAVDLAEQVDVLGPLWAWADQAHLAAHDVQQLG
jgi:hypothetical protein